MHTHGTTVFGCSQSRCRGLRKRDDVENPYAWIHDLAVDRNQHDEQLKPPSGEFCWLVYEDPSLWQDEDEEYPGRSGKMESSARFVTPRRDLSVHIALEDVNSRSEMNKVFRYDALAKDQTFGGVIVSRNREDLELLLELFDPLALQIGIARTAGYGRVRVKNPAIEQGWEEYAPGPAVSGEGRIVVTLLSDAILRGSDGQVDDDLGNNLGLALGLPALRHEWRSHRLRLVGGYNRKWGLPTAQDWAVAAGSVYAFPPGGVDVERLRQLAAGRNRGKANGGVRAVCRRLAHP